MSSFLLMWDVTYQCGNIFSVKEADTYLPCWKFDSV